jgi:hypothetical protein
MYAFAVACFLKKPSAMPVGTYPTVKSVFEGRSLNTFE